MSKWEVIRLLHLLAMAFFVGGQMVLAAAVVPVQRGQADRTAMRTMARRFGIGSLVAVGVLIVTGVAMAERFDLWRDTALQVKMTLVAIAGGMIVLHMRRPQWHAVEGLVFVASLAIVWIGLALSH